MRRWFFHAFLFCFIASASLARAQIREVIVRVDGLACPFCAYGVEKKLKRVEGVESLDIRMREGMVILTPGEGRSIDLEGVPRAVKESGFSLRGMALRATGTVMREGKALFLQYGGPGERLPLEDIDSALGGKFAAFAGSGKAVTVEGLVSGVPGAWALKPESVEALAE